MGPANRIADESSIQREIVSNNKYIYIYNYIIINPISTRGIKGPPAMMHMHDIFKILNDLISGKRIC